MTNKCPPIRDYKRNSRAFPNHYSKKGKTLQYFEQKRNDGVIHNVDFSAIAERIHEHIAERLRLSWQEWFDTLVERSNEWRTLTHYLEEDYLSVGDWTWMANDGQQKSHTRYAILRECMPKRTIDGFMFEDLVTGYGG